MTDTSATVVVVAGGSGSTSQPQQQPSLGMGYRQCLLVSTAALLTETGFDMSSTVALESLAELLQSFIVELGRSSRAFTELACRTEPLGADVLLALTEMGYPSGYNLVRIKQPCSFYIILFLLSYSFMLSFKRVHQLLLSIYSSSVNFF